MTFTFSWSLSETFGSDEKCFSLNANQDGILWFGFGYYGVMQDGDIVPVDRVKAKALVTMLSKYLELTKGTKDINKDRKPYNCMLDNASGL